MLQAIKLKPLTEDELEAMADALAESGQYRVQRRIKPRPRIEPPTCTELKRALLIDMETTAPAEGVARYPSVTPPTPGQRSQIR